MFVYVAFDFILSFPLYNHVSCNLLSIVVCMFKVNFGHLSIHHLLFCYRLASHCMSHIQIFVFKL